MKYYKNLSADNKIQTVDLNKFYFIRCKIQEQDDAIIYLININRNSNFYRILLYLNAINYKCKILNSLKKQDKAIYNLILFAKKKGVNVEFYIYELHL